MMVTSNELYNKFQELIAELGKRERKHIHYKSFRNFIANLDSIKTPSIKTRVSQLLEEYVLLVQGNSKDINRDFSNWLAKEYLFVIGDMFKHETFFIEIFRWEYALIISIVIDIILIAAKIAINFIIPIPIVSIIVLLYYIFYLLPIMKSGKSFGMYY